MSTPPLFWVPSAWFDGLAVGASASIDGEEGRHAATVRRLAPGEQVTLADGEGRFAHAEVTAASSAGLSVRVTGLGQEPAALPQLVLVQALAKGGRDEQAIEAATELGVNRVQPWAARHCVVVWSASKRDRAQAKWASVVTAAAKQARRASIPQVSSLLDSAGLAAAIAANPEALVLVLDGTGEPLTSVLPETPPAQIWLAVGPEGGIAPEELSQLSAAGATVVRLGPTVLRASSAGPAALAVVAARYLWED